MHFRNLAPALALLCAFSSSTLGFCQTEAARSAPPQRGDIFAGLSYISSDATFSSSHGGDIFGWKAGLDVKAYAWLALDAEFGAGYARVTNASSTDYTFLIGPRVFLPMHRALRVRPFADALVGGAYNSIGKSVDSLKSSSSLVAQFDGGLDYRFARRLSWRGQFGYLYSKGITHINNEVQNVPNPPAWHVALSTGLVFRF